MDVPALVTEAARKAGVLWVTVPGQRPVAAWQVWRDGSTYVLTGPGEQPLPGLAEAEECELTARSSDTGGRIVTWRARVVRLEPGGEEWRGVVPALLTARLNLADFADAEARWAATAAVLRLVPTGELVETGGSLPTGRGGTGRGGAGRGGGPDGGADAEARPASGRPEPPSLRAVGSRRLPPVPPRH